MVWVVVAVIPSWVVVLPCLNTVSWEPEVSADAVPLRDTLELVESPEFALLATLPPRKWPST